MQYDFWKVKSLVKCNVQYHWLLYPILCNVHPVDIQRFFCVWNKYIFSNAIKRKKNVFVNVTSALMISVFHVMIMDNCEIFLEFNRKKVSCHILLFIFVPFVSVEYCVWYWLVVWKYKETYWSIVLLQCKNLSVNVYFFTTIAKII